MFAPTNNSSKKTAPALPGIFNRKRPHTPPISIITFFNLLSFIFCLVFCQRSTEPIAPINNLPDTTSHAIIWQIDTVGSYGSIFRDVAVINDSLIWAVGEIYDDERNQYGLATRNGEYWTFKYLRLPSMSGGSITPRDLYVVSKTKIWFASGSIFLLENSNFSMPRQANPDEGYVHKIWASSENDIWFVGTKGLIIHYDGSSFTTMEKLTDIELTDVWGTGPDNVWASGYTETVGTIILHYDGSSWSKFHERSWDEYVHLDTAVISGPAVSIWTDSKDYIWLITYWGLYKVNSKDSKDFIRYPEISGYRIWVQKMRGIASNDLLFCGDFTAFWHFNGISTFYYPEFKGRVNFISITTHNNNFYIGGVDYNSGKAILLSSRR